ncbi:MAG TPA: DUF4824 family protein [Vicinamibacterales bacterium]|nr:DUF4824 family protein [Vicinamibacterales bacterium]
MRRWLLLAAALIVCVTNVVALGTGYLNRRNAPAGAITLTERELRITASGSESTATILRLEWTSPDNEGFPCDKIRPLGFTCPDRPVSAERRVLEQPQRNGYIVLEYDGPAYQRVRKRAEALAAQQSAENPAVKPDPSSLDRLTRLVAIDVGADADTLRRTYPDASRYLITTARIGAVAKGVSVSPPLVTLSGFVISVMPSTINVPLPLSTRLRDASALHYRNPPRSWTPSYTVTLRYGRFLEPWIVDVRPN